MVTNFSFPKSNINKLMLSGIITVKEDIKGDIDFTIESTRCDWNMTNCAIFSSTTIKDMCKKFTEKNKFYTSAFERIKPSLKCPIKTGNYLLEESSIDLLTFAMLPFDGYVWVVTFKMASGDIKNKTKKLIMCLNTEIKISRAKRPGRN